MFFMSLALTLFSFWLQPLAFSDVILATTNSKGLNLFLNWLPLFLLMLFFYFAGTGAATAATVAGGAAILFGFANRTKILLRHDPLLPWDLHLGGEVAGIIRGFGAGFIFGVIGFAVLYILLAVIAAYIIQSKKIDRKIRLGGVVGCLVIVLLLNNPLYNNPAITHRMYVTGNVWNTVNQHNSRGFVFSFINAFHTYRVLTPEGYDRDAVIEAINRGDTSGLERLQNKTHPHIIMVMGEAFSDIALHPDFCFDGFTHPLKNWQRLTQEGINGHIVVPVMGGGTAQTEFDVLTGLNARQFTGVPFAFRMITSGFDSMASLLNSVGYRSEFMHPGFGWFYNRQNVYPLLGFDRTVFIDEFLGVPTKGWYISEYETINRLLEMFTQHRYEFPGKPYFHFAVTIQNHGPYVDKYLTAGPVTGANFSTGLDLPEVDINALSNYFHGLHDADRELGRLTDYLNTLNEPVVLVYFGDHKPALHPRIYDALFAYEPGSLEEITWLFRTPFLIWFNDAFGNETFENETAQEKPLKDDEVYLFSASFLGAYVMELLGFTQLSPFWDFNTELRRLFPVMVHTQDTDNFYLQLYRDWSYFKLFDSR